MTSMMVEIGLSGGATLALHVPLWKGKIGPASAFLEEQDWPCKCLSGRTLALQVPFRTLALHAPSWLAHVLMVIVTITQVTC